MGCAPQKDRLTMTTNFLGHFLVQQGVITEDQLEDAVRYQREMNKRLGDVAVERGALSRDQVDEICAKQREDARMFGSIAVNDLHISRKRLDELLFIQKIHYIYLGEALLLRGHITSDQYASLMQDFYDLEDDRKLNLKYVQEFFAENKTLSSMVEAFMRAYSRYVGDTIKIGAIGYECNPGDYTEAVELKGDVSGGRDFCCAILLSERVAAQLRALPDDLVEKSSLGHEAGLFFEVVMSYFSSMLRERGLILERATGRASTVETPLPEKAALIRLDAPAGICGVSLSCMEADP